MPIRKRPLYFVLAFLMSFPILASATPAQAAWLTYCSRSQGRGVICGSGSYKTITGGSIETGTWGTAYVRSDAQYTNTYYRASGSSGHATMTHSKLSPAYSTCWWDGMSGTMFVTCKYYNAA